MGTVIGQLIIYMRKCRPSLSNRQILIRGQKQIHAYSIYMTDLLNIPDFSVCLEKLSNLVFKYFLNKQSYSHAFVLNNIV